VPVCGGWKSCSLAIPPFAPSWESLERIVSWQDRALALEETFSLDDRPVYPLPYATEENIAVASDKKVVVINK